MTLSAEQPSGTRSAVNRGEAASSQVGASDTESENPARNTAETLPFRASGVARPDGVVEGYFTRREKIGRILWSIVQATLFRFSPRRSDSWRSTLLRLFGAKIGRVKLLRSTVRIEIPWNIEIGDGAQVGDRVYLYSLGRISIGEFTVISQFSHICAGTHDFERTDFPLLRTPIRIGSRCWIAAETFVGPGVTIGDGVVVGARGSVVKDLPAWTVCVGSPAKPISPRRLTDPATGRRIDPG